MIQNVQKAVFGTHDLNGPLGDVAAVVRSHMNGLQHFERTVERTTETMPPALKQLL